MFQIKRRVKGCTTQGAQPEIVKELATYKECLAYLQENNNANDLYLDFNLPNLKNKKHRR